MQEDFPLLSPHPSARPFIITLSITPTSLNPRRFYISFHSSILSAPNILLGTGTEGEKRSSRGEVKKARSSEFKKTVKNASNVNKYASFSSLCNLLHPSLSPCCPCSIFASPSLHPHSILAGPWHHASYRSPNPCTRNPPPFHSHFTTYPCLGLFTSFSASFFFVGGEGGRQEAVEKRRGKAQIKRGKAQVDRYQ